MRIILLKIIPCAVIVRQTCIKVLTAHGDIKKIRRFLKCFFTDFFKKKKGVSTGGLSMNNMKSKQSAVLLARYKPSLATHFRENDQGPLFTWALAFLLHPGSFEFWNSLRRFFWSFAENLLTVPLQNGWQDRMSNDWVWYWGGRQRFLLDNCPWESLQEKEDVPGIITSMLNYLSFSYFFSKDHSNENHASIQSFINIGHNPRLKLEA